MNIGKPRKCIKKRKDRQEAKRVDKRPQNISLATMKLTAKRGLIIAGAALLVICSPCSAAEIAVSVGKVALEPGESQSIKVVCDNQDKRENALC